MPTSSPWWEGWRRAGSGLGLAFPGGECMKDAHSQGDFLML